MASYNKHTDRIVGYKKYKTTISIGMPIFGTDLKEMCKYCPFCERRSNGTYICNNPNTNIPFGISPYIEPEALGLPVWCPLEEEENRNEEY